MSQQIVGLYKALINFQLDQYAQEVILYRDRPMRVTVVETSRWSVFTDILHRLIWGVSLSMEYIHPSIVSGGRSITWSWGSLQTYRTLGFAVLYQVFFWLASWLTTDEVHESPEHFEQDCSDLNLTTRYPYSYPLRSTFGYERALMDSMVSPFGFWYDVDTNCLSLDTGGLFQPDDFYPGYQSLENFRVRLSLGEGTCRLTSVTQNEIPLDLTDQYDMARLQSVTAVSTTFVTHFIVTHFVIANQIVSQTVRLLASTHPVRILLSPTEERVFEICEAAHLSLLSPTGFAGSVMKLTPTGLKRVLESFNDKAVQRRYVNGIVYSHLQTVDSPIPVVRDAIQWYRLLHAFVSKFIEQHVTESDLGPSVKEWVQSLQHLIESTGSTRDKIIAICTLQLYANVIHETNSNEFQSMVLNPFEGYNLSLRRRRDMTSKVRDWIPLRIDVLRTVSVTGYTQYNGNSMCTRYKDLSIQGQYRTIFEEFVEDLNTLQYCLETTLLSPFRVEASVGW